MKYRQFYCVAIFSLTLIQLGMTSSGWCAGAARLTAITIYDQNDFDTSGLKMPVVDVTQTICSVTDSATTYEAFYDTVAGLTVVNSSRTAIKFTKFWYTIYLDSGATTSGKLAPATPIEILPGKTGEVLSLFLRSNGGQKYADGNASALAADLGFKNVKFYLQGRTALGKTVTLSHTLTLSFREVNRCSS